jgi:hypothetical protein
LTTGWARKNCTFAFIVFVLHEGFTQNILETPGSVASSTPSGTPFRDQLNINQEPVGANLDELRKQLRTLPKPKNDFEIVLPEEETALEESAEVSFRFLKLCVFKKYNVLFQDWVEDAAERDERRAQLLAKKQEQELKKRTHVVQRNLPIPSKPNEQYKKRSTVQSDLAKVGFILSKKT